jgi:hypothetical protein
VTGAANGRSPPFVPNAAPRLKASNGLNADI